MPITVKTQSKRERIGIIQRSKASNHFADAANAAASAAFKEIHWLEVGQAVPDAGITVDQFNVTSQYGTHIEKERRFVDPNSGLIRVPFSGTADKSTLSIFLAAAMQTVSEAATTPYKKIFTSNGLTNLPNWANNEGYLFDIAIYNGASADDGILIRRCIIDQLTITVNFRVKGIAKLFKISGSFVGNQILYRQTFTLGNWTNTAAQNFLNDQDTWVMLDNNFNEMEIGGVSYSSEYLHDFSLNINNRIEGDNQGVGGIAGQYTWSPEYTSTINFWHNSVTEALIETLKEDDLVKIFLCNDAADAFTDGKFHIYSASGGAMNGSKVYEGDYLKEQINARLYALAGATAVTITFTDTIDYGY